MAITDPIQILRTPLSAKRKPAVLATLVTNAAFWAVNHGSHAINGIRDLGAFGSVIAYDKGTTSYNIAARIAHDSGNKKPLSDFIQVVAQGDELLRLRDKHKGANAVALSPDILQIEELTSNGEVSVELALGETPEYNDVIVTALVTSHDFVAANQEICRGVVMGIQRALLMIRRRDPDVLRFARDYFHFAERAEGAVTKAIKAGVVPANVTVARAHWMNAAKAYFESNTVGKSWSKQDETKAQDYYFACIEPYGGISEHAVTRVTVDPIAPVKTQKWSEILPFAAMLIAIVITASFGWFPAFVITIGLFFAWAITRLFKDTKRLLRYAFAVFGIAGLACVVLPFIEPFHLKQKEDLLLPLGFGFLVPTVLEFIKYVEREKKDGNRS